MEKKITINTLADISAKEQNEIKVELIEGVEITVQRCLPMEVKVAVIADIVRNCAFGIEPYFNPLKLKVLATLMTIDSCTDIQVFTDDNDDIYAIYDALSAAEVLDKVLPYTDYQEIVNWSYESAEALIKYRNSFIGAFDEMKEKFNSDETQEQLQGLLDEIKNSPEVQDLLDFYKNENV